LQVGIHATLLGETLTREGFERARQAGADCLEFPSPGERGLNPDRPDEVERIGRELEATGLRPWTLHADFGPKLDLGSPYPEARRAGIANILLSARLLTDVGGEMVVVHPGVGDMRDEERPERVRACRESLEALLEEAARLPVRFAIENMLPRHVGDCAAELAALLRGLPQDRIGFCYDTGHARLCPDGLEIARSMAGRMLTIHLQDNVGEGDAHLMPFDGTIDWAAVARMLDEADYRGPYVFETALPTAEEVIRRARETAARLHSLRAIGAVDDQ
jgi:sugar phosphate isomerase/epimerase